MARLGLCLFLIFLSGWAATLADEAEGPAHVREPRGIKRRCKKYGICPGGLGGHQSGHGSYQGAQGGYGGQQGGGYQGYPPINIGISQSQSSANAGGGGYGHGSYPNNYQYNGGFGGHGYPSQGYQGQSGYPGHFGNGQGAYNQQFNGNYYGPSSGGGYQSGYPHYQSGYPHYQGGYPQNQGVFGFQGPFGNGYFDEGEKPVVEHSDYHEHDYGNVNQVEAGSFAVAGRKN